jgi:hypothetical protein
MQVKNIVEIELSFSQLYLHLMQVWRTCSHPLY